MGAEEKKSLSSMKPDATESEKTGFKLHYFPDIPMDASLNARRCLPAGGHFKRSHFENIDSARDSLSAGADQNLPFRKTRPLSPAQIEDPSYQRGFAEGRQKGFADGETAGFDRSLENLEPVLNSLQEVLLQLENIRQETYQSIEKEVVELALAIARKVICREVEISREVVVCVAREALAKVENPGKIKIKMSPSDLQFINQTKYQLSSLFENMDNVIVEAEDSIQSGGCVIETDLGEIDARIEKQLQALEESFRLETDKLQAPIEPK